MKNLIAILFITPLFSLAQNVGVGTSTPQEKFDVAGGLKVGNTTSNNAGVIRYGTDAELKGNQGSGWKSLIASGSSYLFAGFTSNVRNAAVATPYTITVPADGQYVIILTSDMENSQNYSGTVYDTHGFIYLKLGTSTLLSHHALKNELESYGTGYTISLVPAEFPKVAIWNLTKNDLLSIEARLDATGTPAPTSNWTINSLSIILIKLN